MAKFVEVQGYPGLVRNTESNMILNVDFEKIERAREAKRLRKLQKEKDADLENKINSLEKDMSEIKELLKTLTKNL